MDTSHDSARTLIAQHFRARITPTGERTMRTHLAECAACRAHYERHLMLAKLDPSVAKLEDRLAQGLGLASPRSTPTGPILLMGLAFVVSVIFFFVPARALKTPAFEARGISSPRPGAELFIFRVR